MHSTVEQSASFLKKLPCNTGDKGTQRCRISPNLLTEIGCPVGAYIQILVTEPSGVRHFMCSCWPRKDCKDGYIQYDESVFSTMDEQFTKINNVLTNSQQHKVDTFTLSVLQTVSCANLSVCIVANSIKCLRSLKLLNKQCSVKLQTMSRNCLVNICVVNDCIVDCRYNKIANYYGIHAIIIMNMHDKVGMIINESTNVNVLKIISNEKYQQQHRKSNMLFAELGGLKVEMQNIMNMIHTNTSHSSQISRLCLPQGILLYGPPGCGKTSLVRYITQRTDAYLVMVNGSEIVGSRPGESECNLEERFQHAIDSTDDDLCIIFIDEIDVICPKRNVDPNVTKSSLTSQLLMLMDKLKAYHNVKVIAATNRPSALDPAIRRPGRFDREIIVSIPSTSQRVDILTTLTRRVPLSCDVDLESLAKVTKGYVGADLKCLCHEAAYACMSESRKLQIDSGEITTHHFKTALSTITPSTQRGCDALVDTKPVSWSDIGGLDDVKRKVIQAVEWPIKHPESFARLGLPQPKGVLLFGPPGCCKTTLVRAAASGSGATFFSLSSAQLYSPYVGDAERALTEAFQRARMSQPAILFLDEIDSVVGKRSEGGGRGIQERLLSTLLNEMDGIGLRVDRNVTTTRLLEGDNDPCDPSEVRHTVDNSSVLVVAATNRPDMVDEAVLRPGRFDCIIYVPPPDLKAREEILKVHTRDMPLCKDMDLCSLAGRCDMYTGADLENVCKEAALYALTRDGLQADIVTQDHFDHVLSTYQPSLTQDTLLQYSSPKQRIS